MKLSKVLLMILAGFLISFAHHFRFEDFILNPNLIGFTVATLGLVLVLKNVAFLQNGKHRFFLGLTAGIVAYAIVLYWIVIALKEFGELPLVLSLLIALALWIYCALYIGVWAWIAGSTHVQSQSIGLRLWIWASAFAGLEAIREHLFTGFPWGEIGFHFSNFSFIAKSASIWGVHGLSFVWIFFVGSVLYFQEWWPQRLTRRFVVGSWTFFILIFVYGAWFSFSKEDTKPVSIALVQPNISQDLKWSSEKASGHFESLVKMTQEAALNSPDLIVWPETAYPFYVQLSQKQFPFSSTIPVLVGAVVGEHGINRNSALLVEGQSIQSRYDKIHLVPFGEFVPFEDWMPFEKLVQNVGRFVRGGKDQPLLETSINPMKIGPLICFEDVFAENSVIHAASGAQLLVNMTNDAWYGKSSALRQHVDVANMQVMSTGVPMVRATNTGVSSVLTTEYRQDFEDHVQKNIYVEVPISKEPKRTFFVTTYPLMQWIWWLLFVIALLWKFRDPTRKIFYSKSLK